MKNMKLLILVLILSLFENLNAIKIPGGKKPLPPTPAAVPAKVVIPSSSAPVRAISIENQLKNIKTKVSQSTLLKSLEEQESELSKLMQSNQEKILENENLSVLYSETLSLIEDLKNKFKEKPVTAGKEPAKVEPISFPPSSSAIPTPQEPQISLVEQKGELSDERQAFAMEIDNEDINLKSFIDYDFETKITTKPTIKQINSKNEERYKKTNTDYEEAMRAFLKIIQDLKSDITTPFGSITSELRNLDQKTNFKDLFYRARLFSGSKSNLESLVFLVYEIITLFNKIKQAQFEYNVTKMEVINMEGKLIKFKVEFIKLIPKSHHQYVETIFLNLQPKISHILEVK